MMIEFSKMAKAMRALIKRQHGQSVTEVVLVVALVATGAVAGMDSVASKVGSAFTSMSQTIGSWSGIGVHGS